MTMQLPSMTLKALQDIARCSGIPSSGTKNVVRDRILAHMTRVKEQGVPPSILSFDLGYRNLAYVHMNKDNHILAWNKVDLGLPGFHPSVAAPVVREFLRCHIQPMLPLAGAVVIEQQRARTGGGPGVFEHTLRVNCVEAILWATLLDLAPHHHLECVPRQQVDRMWPALSGTGKKRAGAAMVTMWLHDGTLTCDPTLKEMYLCQTKQDDLSDCVVQARTWFAWRQYAHTWAMDHLFL